MAAERTPAGSSWVSAAHALAVRVNRRARWTAALHRLGWILLVAGVVALLWRVLGAPRAARVEMLTVVAVLAAGLLAGLVPALRAARRVPPVSDADAAWALDRLARAGGRGLAAAAATGPAASEAAHAGGGIQPPPAVRLLPPRGLLPVLAAVLVAAVALLAPTRREAALPVDSAALGGNAGSGTGTGSGTGGPATSADAADRTEEDSAAAAEAEARALDARAAAAERVRTALDLPEDGPLDAAELAERLRDPARRKAAADAAEPNTPLADLLGDEDVSSDALARLLAEGTDNRTLASERRRAAAGARAMLDRLAVPPARRGVVERYLERTD